MAHRNRYNCLIKIDSDHYMDLRTGEVKEYNHGSSRASNIATVRKSLESLRDLLNTNVIDTRFCRWITLTYAENMTDTKRLYEDWTNFIKRLRYRYGHFEYIVAMEPQGRGSWHAHVVAIFPHIAPYIPNDVLRDIWGYGFVTVKRIDEVDNVGVYLTAYLGDMELTEALSAGLSLPDRLDIKEVDLLDDEGQALTKKYVKGARLSMYPPGFNLYRFSRGVKKPEITYMTQKSAKEKVSAATLTFRSAVRITDEESGYQNIIQHEYYNMNPRERNK